MADTTNDRIRSAHVVNKYYRQIGTTAASTWLAQANNIFNRLDTTRGFEDFGIFPLSHSSIVMMISSVSINGILYNLRLCGPTDNLFFGYLFLCPLAEFQVDTPTSFRVPAQSAYWSLDPSGVRRLSGEVAEALGFPAIQVEMSTHLKSWDASVYDGIRHFHEAKGFAPSSQEVALELGDSLFQLSCDREVLFSHRKPRIIVSILL
jgi:hypothetical protein